jgi:hypothetical protein
MDFIKINDDFVEDEQVDDIGFIENNKFYNTTSNHVQNKRVLPSQTLLPKNVGGNGTIYNPNLVEKQPEKKKVTYDDILSSLNMKVINGKLQIVRGDSDAYSQAQQFANPYTKSKNMNTKNNTPSYTKQNEFYNKFLQAQSQPQIEVETTPLTEEEKKRLLMIQYIKHQQQRQHISRVKSRKLNFV